MKLDDRTTELIAVGASIAANCQPCLQYHEPKARKSGAGSEEIAAAIEIAKAVRKGAAAKMDEFAANLNASPFKIDCGDGKGCGCGC